MATKSHPNRPRIAVLALAAVALAVASAGHAGSPDALPLRVGLDKAEVVRLNGTAAIVLVANPQIADVVLERGKLLFVLGKREGETRLYVYSDSGQRLIERDVIVAPQHERVVTVTRGTRATTYGCDARCAAVRSAATTPDAASAAIPEPAANRTPAAASPPAVITPAP